MKVKVLIPIYRTDLTEYERISLERVNDVLSGYPIVIVKPESLDVTPLLLQYPNLLCESFDDAYFKGIAGYNRLMLSSSFYERFFGSDYILIHQLDVYVFRNELESWCNKGYDYIGAPWLEKPIYRNPIIRLWRDTTLLIKDLRGGKIRLAKKLYNKIGNGGFSLRKVISHYEASLELENKIAFYLAQKRSHQYNEDVFWATEPRYFKYPPVEEALRFSFDKYPNLCYKLCNKQLPFGCHGWYKRKMKHFWKPIIGY